MSEIFFSYSSQDRERVRPFHEALTALGFDVFWDAQVPTATDWDRLIKGKLEQSRCAIVFWSANSAASTNVRHEVDIARGDRKMVQVLLEPMSTKALPMGTIAEQASNLAGWNGDYADVEWIKLLRAVEDMAAPRWMKRKLDELNRMLAAERIKVGEADGRVHDLQVAHDSEVAAQGELRRERDSFYGQIETLRQEVSKKSFDNENLASESRQLRQLLTTLDSQIRSKNEDVAAAVASAQQVASVELRKNQLRLDDALAIAQRLRQTIQTATREREELLHQKAKNAAFIDSLKSLMMAAESKSAEIQKRAGKNAGRAIVFSTWAWGTLLFLDLFFKRGWVISETWKTLILGTIAVEALIAVPSWFSAISLSAHLEKAKKDDIQVAMFWILVPLGLTSYVVFSNVKLEGWYSLVYLGAAIVWLIEWGKGLVKAFEISPPSPASAPASTVPNAESST